ncbi:hypothetical protein ACHAXS_010771 [Conticribra weissflogii]
MNTTSAGKNGRRGVDEMNFFDTTSNKVITSQKVAPPSGATRTQLQLWQRILARRRRQIQSLHQEDFQLFVEDLAMDMASSRFDKNIDNGEGSENRIDLAVGPYSRLLIKTSPPPKNITVQIITLHLLGLFYRSLDNRLSVDQRNHGLELVKKAFSSLDNKVKEQTSPSKSKRGSGESGKVNGNKQRQLDGENTHKEGPCNKRMRNDAVTKDSSINGNMATTVSYNLPTTNHSSVEKNHSVYVNNPILENSNLPQTTKPSPSPAINNHPAVIIKTILPPPPIPLPPPMPFRQISSITFIPDNCAPSPLSASLKPRPACTVTYNSGYELDGLCGTLNDKLCNDILERLETWEPYWKVIDELGKKDLPCLNPSGQTNWTRVGTKTAPCLPSPQSGIVENPPVSCAMVSIDLSKELSKSKFANYRSSSPWGIEWGKAVTYTTGDRRLLVRTLPLKRSAYDVKKRADTHLWPKGTFVQFSQGLNHMGSCSGYAMKILQRRQQSHDPMLWKGMSHALDLSNVINNTQTPFYIKLCSRESVDTSGDSSYEKQIGIVSGSYAVHVAICEYVSPDDLYDRVTGKVPGGDFIIPTMPLDMARSKAKCYLESQTVSIDDSDEEDSNNGGNSGEDNCLTFSLLCPISKSAMETPVRGQKCKHMQCFDLRNFLHANKTVSGGRWRCGVCEEFVSVRTLVRCGLFQAMLDDLRTEVSGIRDRVSLKSDGTWVLLAENKLRYASKSNSGGTTGKESSGPDGNEYDAVSTEKKKPTAEPEVIDLL